MLCGVVVTCVKWQARSRRRSSRALMGLTGSLVWGESCVSGECIWRDAAERRQQHERTPVAAKPIMLAGVAIGRFMLTWR